MSFRAAVRAPLRALRAPLRSTVVRKMSSTPGRPVGVLARVGCLAVWPGCVSLLWMAGMSPRAIADAPRCVWAHCLLSVHLRFAAKKSLFTAEAAENAFANFAAYVIVCLVGCIGLRSSCLCATSVRAGTAAWARCVSSSAGLVEVAYRVCVSVCGPGRCARDQLRGRVGEFALLKFLSDLTDVCLAHSTHAVR